MAAMSREREAVIRVSRARCGWTTRTGADEETVRGGDATAGPDQECMGYAPAVQAAARGWQLHPGYAILPYDPNVHHELRPRIIHRSVAPHAGDSSCPARRSR